MFTQIVVGTDGSAGADIAVGKAVELARLTGAGLLVVAAFKSMLQVAAGADIGMVATDSVESDKAAREHAEQVCATAVQQASAAGVAAQARAVAGDAARVLVDVANEVGADLIVVGNRGMTGVRRFILGSVPNKVAHHCPTSLLVVDTTT